MPTWLAFAMRTAVWKQRSSGHVTTRVITCRKGKLRKKAWEGGKEREIKGGMNGEEGKKEGGK
jgi:hypothetical protein